MAEKAEKKESAAPAAAAPAPKSAAKGGGAAGLLTKTPVLLGGVMLIEAVLLFGGFKLFGGAKPQHASGAELAAGEGAGKGDNKKKTVEINILDFKAPNKVSGRTFLYDVSLYVVTKAEFEQRVKSTIEDKKALIQDRFRTIIAQSDPEKLGGGSEPGLETLRRQVKYQLDEILGEGLIDEVLVPRCIPFRADY
jgi:flagellar basal body-associated protein FliL